MERLKHGTFKLMTLEQQIQHRRDLHNNWASKHRDFLRKKYKKYYESWKINKPFECVCIKCGANFNAPRKLYKLCDKCKENVHLQAQKTRNALEKKRAEYRQKIQQILKMGEKGIAQQKIAEKFGYTQCAISWILRKYGIHRQQKTIDKTL